MVDHSYSPAISRREMLRRAGMGFGMLGLAGTLQTAGQFGPATAATARTHFPARAKRVIFLFLNGGPSHVDTFDPKPALKTYAGQQPAGQLYKKSAGTGFMPSPLSFAPAGKSGIELSETLPNLARVIDECCIIRSMHTDVPNHEP